MMLAASTVFSLFDSRGRDDLDNMPLRQLVLNVVVLGPAVETLLFQSTIFALANSLKATIWQKLCLMTCIFALPHFFVSMQTGVTAGLILGFYLSYIYSTSRTKSLGWAIGLTIAFHSLSNSFFLALGLLFDQ